MKAIIILLTFFSLSVFAEDEFNVYVNTFDQDMDTSSITEKEVKKTQGPGKLKDQTRELPTPPTMNGIFQEADLLDEVSKMDQVERDIFFLKVWKRPIEGVLPRYPQIPKNKIIKLKKVIEERVK